MNDSRNGGGRPIGRRRSDRIAGASPANEQSVQQANVAARSDDPVVVTGPPGSGREHFARAIHAWSTRAAGPLVAFSAAATPELLHARELFGALESGEPLLDGGFAGAVERAAGGTLLVAEIEALAASAREALGAALRSRSFLREGDTAARPLTCRVIATAHSESSLAGFESAQRVEIAPLAERREDILPLAVHFLSLFAEEEELAPVGFTPDARECLLEEPWTGNVRELRERIRQAIRLDGNGAISVEALALSTGGSEIPSFKDAKRAFEARYVRSLLQRCNGNISRAARLAKKDRKDFYDVIRRTGVDPQEFRG